MKKQRLFVFLALMCIVALLVPFAASATETTDGFSADGNYYYRDGVTVTEQIIEHEGKLYFFDGSGLLCRDQSFWYNGYSYRAKEDGSLYVNEWYEDRGSKAYYGEEGKAPDDFLQVDGVWYYFNVLGEVCKERAVWSDDYRAWYAMSEDGTSHQRLALGWNNAYGAWYYLAAEAEGYEYYGGTRVLSYEVMEIGGKLYHFDWRGIMLEDSYKSSSDGNFRAKEDGSLYVNEWYKNEYGQWEYYGKDGYGAQGFVEIGGVTYFFDRWSCMACDCVEWSYEDEAWYAFSADGEAHQKLEKGLNRVFGTAYFLAEENGDLYPANDIRVIDGKEYKFNDYTRQLETNTYVGYYYSEVNGRYVDGYAGADGVITLYAWYQDEFGNWRYIMDGEELWDGVYNIGSKWYLFRWGSLVMEPGVPDDYRYSDYYVSRTDGELYVNKWYYSEIEYDEEIGWVYYDDSARMVKDTVMQIGGSWYGFDYNGVMYENAIVQLEGKAYSFDGSGKGTQLKDGWYSDPEDGTSIRVQGGELAEGVLTVGGKTYCFENGRMLAAHSYYGEYNGVEGWFLFDVNGELVTRARTSGGWYDMVVMEGVHFWFYVNTDNTLAYGEWVQSGGKWYYMDPEMMQNRAFYEEDEKLVYVADVNGVCTALRGDGLHTVNGITVYLENGRAVTSAWRKVNGYWYYFDAYGIGCYGGAQHVGENLYYFDSYGKLAITGWVYGSGAWYYADPNNDGILLTGLQTVGSNQYVFTNWGEMYSDGIFEHDGTMYLLAADGRVLHTFTDGWNQVGGDWYYVQDGNVVTDEVIEVNGKWYGFADCGVMYSGGIHMVWGDRYYFADSGEILTGWYKVDGRWVYASEEYYYPWLCIGYEYINGKEYIFDNYGYLRIGTFTYGGAIYTTDSDGAIIKWDLVPEGWFYEDGYWHYVTGENFTGWMGDYYIRDNQMVFAETVEYDGKLYCLKSDGICLKNGWAQCYDYWEPYWVLARADGSLYCSQWVQQGGIWYYFSGRMMLADTIAWIDGELHEFDADGKWLGEYEYETYLSEAGLGLKDGWHKINGKWYYYLSGLPATGEICDGGKYYMLDYGTAEMAENCIASADYTDWFYYGADGARRDYVGWVLINGVWYYFNPDHTVYFGLVSDSTKMWCYTRLVYDDETDKYYSEQVFNEYVVVGSNIYYFNKAGYSPCALGGTGWYEVEGDWYYLENGCLLRNTMRTIGGKVYAFGWYGNMVAGDTWYSDNGELFFGKDGALVTKAGWYQNWENRWVYVNSEGYIYSYGIYKIGGKEYAFKHGVWIP